MGSDLHDFDFVAGTDRDKPQVCTVDFHLRRLALLSEANHNPEVRKRLKNANGPMVHHRGLTPKCMSPV